MYTSFQIKNFRCFDNLRLDNLAQVNLIAGKNNSGKTALLEALFIYSGAYNPSLAFRVNGLRGIENLRVEFNSWAEGPWDTLFTDFDLSKEIELKGWYANKEQRTIKLKTVRDIDKIAELTPFIKSEVDENANPVAILDRSHILSLEYAEKNGNKSGTYYAVLDVRRGLIDPVTPSPPFQTVFLTARHRSSKEDTARRFSQLDITGRLDILLNALRIVEPRLKRLTLGYGTSSEPLIYGDVGSHRLVPLALMGDGIGRLAELVLALAYAENGVILTDEIENGLHYSILNDMWTVLKQAAKEFNVQIFATTHSLECIRAAHEAFEESKTYDFRYHRLDRTKTGVIRVVSYDEDVMEAAIETNSEVR